MGSEFVGGILTSGVESQLALSAAKISEVMKNQIELQQTLLEGYGKAASANSAAVLSAGEKAADVESQNANVSFLQGGFGLATPLSQVGYRSYREGMVGTPADLKEINEDSQKVKTIKDALHSNDADIVSGKNAEAQELSEEQMDNLRQKSVIGNKKSGEAGYSDEDIEAVKLAKRMRSNGPKNEASRSSRLYDDLEEKINKAEDGVNNRRQRYDGDTDRRSSYVQSATQSLTSFMTGTGQTLVSNARQAQAGADAVRTMSDFATNNQKSGVDTAQQAYSNTAQIYAEQIRVIGDLARANAPV